MGQVNGRSVLLKLCAPRGEGPPIWVRLLVRAVLTPRNVVFVGPDLIVEAGAAKRCPSTTLSRDDSSWSESRTKSAIVFPMRLCIQPAPGAP